MAKQQQILPEAVAAAGYKLRKDAPVKFYDLHFGDIDFTDLSLERAADLLAAGNEYLEKPGK